ncbi:MAG: cell division protein FtsQ [Lentimonas sp.]|jgi:cell division protein FtsQ
MWNLKNIKSFIISRPSVRFILLFFQNRIFPYFKYAFCIAAVFLLIVAIYFIFFKKDHIEKAKNSLSKYAYRVINYGNDYSKIKVSGNEFTDYEGIVSIAREYVIKDKNIHNQQTLNSLKNEIEKLPWIKTVLINVNLQGSLNIEVGEYKPFAIWKDDKEYVVTKGGEVVFIPNFKPPEELIILTGNDAYKNIQPLFDVFAIDPEISDDIYSATWVGGRRWDIRFKNGLLIKLPSHKSKISINSAWKDLVKIYNSPGSLIGLESVDLRIANKIYLEYDRHISQELIDY